MTKKYPLFVKSLVTAIFTFGSPQIFCQNLEAIGKGKPISLTGALSANQILYSASGIESRRHPYSCFLSGNLNISLYEWNIPLSFSYSNRNFSYQQPFNQYAIHPTYKSVTGHIGYTSMSLSPYTVNGHLFLGGAAEISPQGKWKVSALGGRFLKAVKADTIHKSITPSFKRIGYGFKLTYGDDQTFADVVMFQARDHINHAQPIPDSTGILPKENFVVGIAAGKTILNRIVVRAELASSAMSNDTRAPETTRPHPLSRVGILHKSRTSSTYYNAFKASIDLRQKSYITGIAYERIDPGYSTLGAYYFNNDLENIVLNVSTSWLQGKLTAALSTGLQRDNLAQTKISTTRRMVSSINLAYTPSERLNISSAFSSFQSYTNIHSRVAQVNELMPYPNADTLNFLQVSSSGNLNVGCILVNKKDRKQNLSISLNYQNTADQHGGVPNQQTQFYMLSTASSLSIGPRKLTLTTSVNSTLTAGGIATKMIGPSISITKSLFDKKMQAMFSVVHNRIYSDAAQVSGVVNCRLGANLSLKKSHQLNFGAVICQRKSTQTTTEYILNIGYQYTFEKHT